MNRRSRLEHSGDGIDKVSPIVRQMKKGLNAKVCDYFVYGSRHNGIWRRANSKGQPTSTGFGRVKLKVNGQRVTCEKLAEMARSALKQKEPSAIMEG